MERLHDARQEGGRNCHSGPGRINKWFGRPGAGSWLSRRLYIIGDRCDLERRLRFEDITVLLPSVQLLVVTVSFTNAWTTLGMVGVP